MNLNIIFAGVGGQGIIVLSDILCEAAALDGYDVTKAEIHGMAQRGGSITAHTKINNKNIQTPLIETGKADILIGFEILETTRTLHMLKNNGTIIINTKHIPPNNPHKNNTQKTTQQLLNILKTKTQTIHEIDGPNIAKQLGNDLVINTVLLGALSALPEMPIKPESLKKAMTNRLKEKYLQINLQSFEIGQQNIQNNTKTNTPINP